MSEYSVEEVRARFEASFGKCPEAQLTRNGDGYLFVATDHRWDGWRSAYADLLERIKADESAVPVAQLRLRLDRWDVVGIHGAIEKLHLPAGEYPLFVRPPAQAAQVGISDADVELACKAASMHADGAVFPDAYGDEEAEMTREFMRVALRAVWSAASVAAEPVAQGEADELFNTFRLAYYGSNKSLAPELESFRRAYRAIAAQPRVVPDGWVLVPREPTPKMLAAVAGMEISVRIAEDDTAEYPVPEDDCAEIYRNMLAAAPSPGESE